MKKTNVVVILNELFLGAVIKQRRTELGITQHQLADGICEQNTLSRLENGHQTPRRNVMIALLGRLGIDSDRYTARLTWNEIQERELADELKRRLILFEKALSEDRTALWQQATETLRALASITKPDDTINRQLILRAQAILGGKDGPFPFEVQRAMLLEAIRLTMPKFDPDRIRDGLYAPEEITVINQYAVTYIEERNHPMAIHILRQLYEHLHEHHRDISLIHSHMDLIISNLALELDTVKQYEEAYRIAEEGRQLCLKEGRYNMLSSILAAMAECSHFLGNDERSREEYLQSYYMSKAKGDLRLSYYIQLDAFNHLGLELD